VRRVAAAAAAAAARFASPPPSGYGCRPSAGGAPGAQVSDLFREIEDELRRENLLKLWRRYGKYVIAAAVLALVAGGGVAGWRHHLQSEREAQGARYNDAVTVLRAGKEADAVKQFAALAKEEGGYGTLAAFEHANLLAREGKEKAAVAAFDRLAGDTGLAPDLRDVAVLLSVMHALPNGDPQAAIARLKPLTASGKPFRASALDLTAAAMLKAGDRAGALAIYKKLADDLTAPQGVRARAAEMAAALKS
jgi:hypothetical protein